MFRRTLSSCSLLIAALVMTGCYDHENLYPVDRELPVSLFAVLDGSGATLWRFSAQPPVVSERIEYGVEPAGAVREFPLAGAPRPLRTGEQIVVVMVAGDRIFRRVGTGMAPSGFRGVYWETSPLRPDKLADALSGRSILTLADREAP